MNRMNKTLLYEQKGAAEVVEAVFVYPVVILTVTLMIYMGVYVLEHSLLQDKASSTAAYTARLAAFPGFGRIAETEDICRTYSWYDGDTDRSQVSEAYSVIKPYRYILSSYDNKTLEDNLIMYVKDLYLRADDIVCSIDCSERYISGRKVSVILKRKVSMPQIFELIGFDTKRTMQVTAYSIVSDNTEFIRSADLAADCAGALSKKYGLSGKLGSMLDKINNSLGWLGVDQKDENSQD